MGKKKTNLQFSIDQDGSFIQFSSHSMSSINLIPPSGREPGQNRMINKSNTADIPFFLSQIVINLLRHQLRRMVMITVVTVIFGIFIQFFRKLSHRNWLNFICHLLWSHRFRFFQKWSLEPSSLEKVINSMIACSSRASYPCGNDKIILPLPSKTEELEDAMIACSQDKSSLILNLTSPRPPTSTSIRRLSTRKHPVSLLFPLNWLLQVTREKLSLSLL